MYQMISIDKLTPHPENCNRMSGKLMTKLEENIRKSGRYETITVRPHPERSGYFQILNGHHRVEILRRLGIEEVKCDVWEVNDVDARLLIATLNRLEGSDVPELRFSLLKNLMDDLDVSDLESLIPETSQQLEELLELSKEDFEALNKQIKESTSHFECDIADLRILDFILNDKQYQMVVKVFEQMMRKEQPKDRNQALYELTKWYSDQGVCLSASLATNELASDGLHYS